MKNIVFKLFTLSLILCSAQVGFAMNNDALVAQIGAIDPALVHGQPRTAYQAGLAPVAPPAKKVKKTYVCEVCDNGKDWRCQSALTRHMRTHTNEKPFKCDEDGCDKAFVQSSDLRNHMRTHTGERLYPCEICEHIATQAGHLRIHMHTHTGEKPFACPITGCSSAFGDPSALKQHLRADKHIRDVAQLVANLNNRTSPSDDNNNDDE